MTISVRKSRTEDHHASKPNRYLPEIMPERHIPQLLGGRGHITLPATKVRPHEDGRAGHGRTRRDRLESAVPGFCALLGVQAAALPAISSTDQWQDAIGCQMPGTDFPVCSPTASARQP